MVDQILPSEVWPIGLLIAALVLEAGVLRFGLDDLDEGYFVQQATRVLHGQVPFRDFESLYSPGLVYVHAALFWLLGGPSLIAPRVVALLARGGLVLAMYAIARPLVRQPWWAAAPGVLLLIGMDDAPVRWEPHPGWLSSMFAVLAAWCLTPRRLASPWHSQLASGACAALAYVFKQNTGVFILLAILLWTRRERPWLSLAAFVAITALWLVPLALAVGDPLRLGVLVGAVSEAGLLAPPEPTLLIPLAGLLGALWLLRREANPTLRWLMLAGIALFLTEYPRMDTLHLLWSTPLLLVLGAVALDRCRWPLGVAASALTMALLLPNWTSRLAYFDVDQPFTDVFGVRAPAQTALELQQTLADVQQRSQPGEPIFVYPTSPLLYVLADRPNPARFDHLNPGAADSAQIQQVLTDLERSKVRVVVVSDFWEHVWGLPGTGPNAALENWLNAHFTTMSRHGAYRVLVASDL